MSAPPSIDAARIGDQVAAFVTDAHIPGASVGVVRGGELVYAQGFGRADIESGRPHALGMRHRIGSITKTMVGLCAMALVDEGKLSLDDRVPALLPDVPFNGPAEALAVRHLMTHTGGIGEVPNVEDLKQMEARLWAPVGEAIPKVGDAYANGITIEAEPGTKWCYANHGWVLLGEIVSRIEGAPIAAVLHRRIFAPLGMDDTDCLDQPHADLTTPYHRPPSEDAKELAERVTGERPKDAPTVDGWNIKGQYLHVKGVAAGAVQSTIGDMAKYASALLAKGGGTVRPDTFAAMTSPQWAPDRRLIHIGMPFFLQTDFGRPSFGHGGGVLGGWSTMLWVFPQDGMAVTTFMNVITDDYDAHDGLLKIIFDAPAHNRTASPVDPDVLASAPGVFEAAPGVLTNVRTVQAAGRVQLSARNGELWLHARRGQWKDGVRLLPSDDDPLFFMIDKDYAQPHHVALVADRAGSITGLRFDRLVELHRTDQVAPWA